MRVPVPRNRLVVLVLVGAVLSAFVSVGLAQPGLVEVPGTDGNETTPESGSPAEGQAGAAEDTAAESTAAPAPSQGLSIERRGEIHIALQGPLQPGQSVTLEAVAGGEPVSGAVVEANGETVGRTNADGEITVPVPHDEFRVEIETEDREGRLRVEK